VQRGLGTSFWPGRFRLVVGLVVFTALAAAGAASGSNPVQVVSAPARFFFPGTFDHSASASATAPVTEPPCQPSASVRDRAAEVLIVGLPNVTDPSDKLAGEVADLGVGGVLITGANVLSRVQVTGLISDIRRRARHPLVVTTDEEPGRVSSFGEIIGYTGSARRLAAQGSTAAMRDLAHQQAKALSSMGIDLDLAPVADLDAGPSDGIIGDRSFSADAAVASKYAFAYAAGLADGGLRSVAKHFPGHGPARGDDHVGRVTASSTLEDLTANDLRPFADLIKAGIPVVMMDNVDYVALDSDLPASLSPRAYQLLRKMGFDGVAITDSVGMGAVNQRWDVAEAAVKAVEAGADGVLTTDASFARDMVHALVVAVQRGQLTEARLNQAAGRMIALAGGDPMAFACQTVEIPKLHTQP